MLTKDLVVLQIKILQIYYFLKICTIFTTLQEEFHVICPSGHINYFTWAPCYLMTFIATTTLLNVAAAATVLNGVSSNRFDQAVLSKQ